MRQWCTYLQCVVALLAGVWLGTSQAEEAVRAMVFFEEPVTLTAVPGKERHLLVVLPQPGLSSPVYALKGMIRYDDVEGQAFLQMNSDFGDKGNFFTKSLAASGPLGYLSGSSGWRPFVLPFYADRGDMASGEPPGEVTLALHLPGSGSVELRDIRLYQYGSDEDPMATTASVPRRRIAILVVIGLLFLSALVALVRRSRRG